MPYVCGNAEYYTKTYHYHDYKFLPHFAAWTEILIQVH